MIARVFLALLLAFGGFASAACAQDIYGPRPGAKQDIPKEQIQASGTIKGIRGGVLYVVTEDGGQWVVNIDPNSRRLGFAGSADAQWLRPGMFVEFNATVNAKGESTTPISIATVLTPTKENPPGISSEAGGSSDELFGVKEEKDKAKEETVKVRVVGQITGMKDNLAIVNGVTATLKVAFAPDAKIAVEVPGADALQLVRAGDKVEFSGWYIQNNKGQAWANEVHVRGSETLTGKKPGPKTPVAKPTKEAGKPAAEEKAAE